MIKNEGIRERELGQHLLWKKIVESYLSRFGHARRRPITVKALLRRVDRMDSSPIVIGRGKPRIAMGKNIRRDLDLNCSCP